MVNFELIVDKLKNTPHWKEDLDTFLKEQGARRTNSIELYACNSTEIWLSYKFRIKFDGNGEFYHFPEERTVCHIHFVFFIIAIF